MPDTNFKLASFMSSIATSRNYALPDHGTPFSATARPKSIAVMGTIDELAPNGQKAPLQDFTHDADFYYRHKALVSDLTYSPQQRKIDSTLDLTKDIGNYKPRALSGDDRREFNPISRSERDLRMRYGDDEAHAQPEASDAQRRRYEAAQFSPIVQDHMYISPEVSPLMTSSQSHPLRSQSMTSFGRDRNNPTPHPFPQHRLSMSITNPELSSEQYRDDTAHDTTSASSPDQYQSPQNSYQSPVSPRHHHHEYHSPMLPPRDQYQSQLRRGPMSPPTYDQPSTHSLAYQQNARLTQSQTSFASPVYSQVP